jgi:hypothetical protein
MNFYLQLLLILFAATALACWCGWGLARLALPVALQPYRGLLTPLIGYSLAIVVGYWFVWTVSGLPLALAVLLPATGALNLVAWRRSGPPQFRVGPEHLPLLALLLLTLLVGIAPLLRYGHPAVIGAGWDIESALPMARYLERGPIAAIADAPPNPLRDLVRDPPRIGKTLGFAIWQGLLDVLLRMEALLTFVPLLAWLRTLGVLAVYVLFRATLGLQRGPALLGAAWTSAGALLLWITYFNFEKQLSAWPLIPLGLLLGVAAVQELALQTTDHRPLTTEDGGSKIEDRGWLRAKDRSSILDPRSSAQPSVVGRRSSVVGMTLTAAMAIAAQVIAYYPAMTLWVPLAVGLAAAVLVEQGVRSASSIPHLPSPSPIVGETERAPSLSPAWETSEAPPRGYPAGWPRGAGSRLRTISCLLGAALALSLVTALLSAPALLDYWHGFSYRYAEQLTTLGVFRYIPFTDIVGLTPYLHGLPGNPPAPPWILAALAAFVGLTLAGLLLPIADGRPPTAEDSRNTQLTTRNAFLHSQFFIHNSQLRWLGLALGALAYLAWLRWWQQYPYAYMKGAAYAGFVFVGLAAAGWQALAARLPRRALLLVAAVPVLLSLPLLAGQARIVASHWSGPGLYPDDVPALLELRQRIPAGSTVTLAADGRTEGVISGLAAYTLDHTTVWGHVRTGYTSSTGGEPDAIGEYALLPAGDDPAPRGYGQPTWRGGSYALYRRPPGVLAHLRLEQVVAPGGAIELSLGHTRLAEGHAALAGGSPRRLDLLVAALRDTSLTLDGKPFAVPAGGAWVRAALPTGRSIELRNAGAAPLLLRAATLAEADGAGGDAVAPLPAALVVGARASALEQTVTATLESLLPDGGPLTLALDIWDSRRGLHYGWYGIEIGAGAQVQTATLRLDLRQGVVQAHSPDGATLPFGAQFEGLREGDYSARLHVGAGAAALATPGELFSFHVGADRTISAVRVGALPLIMTTTDRPPRPLDVRVGDDLRLQGYALDRTSARPGEALLLTLWWQALADPNDERSVLIHLLDPSGVKVAQADGAPARGARPTSQWRAGNTIIDTHQIALPTDLPPGEYKLAFGMYRWPSLERLALRSGEARLDDDVIWVPIVVMR